MALGIRTFKKYFPVILTDNGSEFKNPWDIKKTKAGTHRTYVFYCDPYVSNQKGRLEKNHEYIRYVIPKGRSMYKYTQTLNPCQPVLSSKEQTDNHRETTNLYNQLYF